MVTLWRGYHSQELAQALKAHWHEERLIVLCPQNLRDFSFIERLSFSEVSFGGDWPEDVRALVPHSKEKGNHVPHAIIGVFTSGTTDGEPRLVFYSKENITSSLHSIRRLFNLDSIKRIFCFPQPTHTFGLTLGYLHAIIYNLELDFSAGTYSQKSLAHWYNTVSENTMTLGAPAHFFDLMDWGKRNNMTGQPSYTCIIGGAKVSTRLWNDIKSQLHIQSPSIGYGATEASPGLTHLPPGQEPQDIGEVGYPLENVNFEADTEKGVFFSGPNLCYAFYHKGHLEFPKVLHLNDCLQKKANGSYVYKGRLDCILNRGGVKISLEDVEAKLQQQLNLQVAAATAPDSRLGDDLVLFVQGLFNKVEIQTYIDSQFGFKIKLENVFQIAAIPYNYNLKIDRARVQRFFDLRKTLNFPVSISDIEDYMPHRAPAVWLDQVISASETEGHCRVHYNPTATYNSVEQFRESSAIELIAQTMGYSAVAHQIINGEFDLNRKKMFLAAVTKANFPGFPLTLKENDPLDIFVTCTHQIGPLKIIRGRVSLNEKTLAEAQLKVFAE